MYVKNPRLTSSGKTVSSITAIEVTGCAGAISYYITRYIGTGRTRIVVVDSRYTMDTYSAAQTFGNLPKWIQYILRSLEGRCISLTDREFCEICNHVEVRYPSQRLIPAGNWFDYDFLVEICHIEGGCV